MATRLDKTIDLWCRALLDLGRRNRMIHYRPSKRRSLAITEPAPEVLFEKLVGEDKTLAFRRPIDKKSAPRTHAILSLLSMLGHPVKVTVGDLDYSGDYEHAQSALSYMRSQYRLAHEEQGCHILYLSFGFVEWRDGKGGTKGSPFVESPLILVPVELLQSSPSAPYTLKRRDDDIVVNPALSLVFEKKGITLPLFDENSDELAAFFEAMESMADEHGWRIHRKTSLGLLSFQKISMYRDLEANRKRLVEHPFVRAMAGEEASFLPLSDIDPDTVPYRDTYQVLPADSSQQKAILAAKRGESFVMVGPPGTGKSQTITNIIAELLADGKKILFVSGKNAALQVVYRRLQETGLAAFCLPLHSHRANKREILSDISASLSMKAPKLSESDERDCLSLEEKRTELNAYAKALHQPIEPLGYTAYECAAALSEGEKPLLSLALPTDRATFLKLLTLAARYDTEREVYLSEKDALPLALYGIALEDEELPTFRKALIDLGNAVISITRVGKAAGCECDQLPIDALAPLGRAIETLFAISPEIFTKPNAKAALKAGLSGLDALRRAIDAKTVVERDLLPSIDRFDASLWYIEFSSQVRSALRDPVLSLFLPSKDANLLIQSRKTLSAVLDELVTLSRLVDDSAKALSESLGLPLSEEYSQLAAITAYLPYLDGALYVDPSWYEAASFDKSLLENAKKRAASVIGIEEEIVSTWRADVFDLNYKLLRDKYKSDIGGLFQFISANARRDVKRTLTGYTKTGDSPTDEMITHLFDRLADRSLALRRFLTQEKALKELAGSAYHGVYTDFDALSKGLDFLSALPSELLPPPTPIARYLTLPKSEQKTAYAALSALSKHLGALSAVSDRVGGLLTALEGATSGEIHLSFAQNALNALIKKYDAIRAHTTRELSFDEITQALDAQAYLASYTASGGTSGDIAANERFWSTLAAIAPLMPSEDMLFTLLIALAKKNTAADFAKALQNEGDAAKTAIGMIANAFGDSTLLSLKVKDAKGKVALLLENLPALDRFSPLAECYRKLSEAGYGDAVLEYEAKVIGVSLEKALRFSVMHTLYAKAKAENESLKHFSRLKASRTASSFATLDTRHVNASRKKIVAKLAATMPQGEREWKGEDELSVLEHENAKHRGFMPLRKLFAKIPNLLLTLKPCLMMSPLSVSYFLEKESYAFDLVIFDEASQLFPEDAIGAISRAKQIIIVGDPKQLPPTNFFATRSEASEDEEEDEDELECMPSILESAMTALPKHKLLWHYRSRFESLIAFSNHKIYQKELITFPSPAPDAVNCGIEYHYLENGIYEPIKGYNLREAEECVKLLAEHIATSPERSLGIIAFGKKQQRAIEEAVTNFRLDNPEHEAFFAENREEPFFIKNLENVQGDERDTIIFSIGYGKNPKGKFLMNFGPLSKLGGERRLNVAITRAKKNIKLIGSVLPSDFNLASTDSEGVHLLRAYIDYAINKEEALITRRNELHGEEDLFLDTVEAFLSKEGYSVKRMLGTSLCRVELAVFHPDHKGAIAALMSDGQAFRHAATARDREHLRYGILKEMGWRVYSLYAPAWAQNPAKEEEALLDFLKNGIKEQSELESTLVTVEESVDEAIEETESATGGCESTPYGFDIYREADWARAPITNVFDKERTVTERMHYIVLAEEPIHRELLFRRLASSFKSGKLTESVKKTLDSALAKLIADGITLDASGFLRASGEKPCVRLPKAGSEARAFEYVAKEELAEAMLVILKNAYGATPDSLYHELCRIYGYDRMTQKLRSHCEEALFTLLMTERVRLVDGKIKVL